MLLECTVLQQIRDEYYTADSLRTLFVTFPETCIVEFLREAGFFYLIWKAIYPVQHIIRITHQLTIFGIYIVVKQMQYNPIQLTMTTMAMVAVMKATAIVMTMMLVVILMVDMNICLLKMCVLVPYKCY